MSLYNWDIDETSSSCKYSIDIKIQLHFLTPPKDFANEMERKVMENSINAKAGVWLSNPKNKQNLMNVILGNTNILIP